MLDFNFCSIDEILMKRKSLRKELSTAPNLQELRIAVLGGSTTDKLVDLFEMSLSGPHELV